MHEQNNSLKEVTERELDDWNSILDGGRIYLSISTSKPSLEPIQVLCEGHLDYFPSGVASDLNQLIHRLLEFYLLIPKSCFIGRRPLKRCCLFQKHPVIYLKQVDLTGIDEKKNAKKDAFSYYVLLL